MRVLGLTLAVAGLWGASSAQAACSGQGTRQQALTAPVILTGIIESGPTTPAVVRVEAWEKGSGPQLVEVDTGYYEDYAFGEGVQVRPGERWRLYGEMEDGRLVTGTCWGSHVLTVPATAPEARLRTAGRARGRVRGVARTLTVASTFAGRALAAGPLPVLGAARGQALRLRFSARVADVRLVGAPRGARLTHRRQGWTLRLPRRARRSVRIVADTGDGFFATLVRPVAR